MKKNKIKVILGNPFLLAVVSALLLRLAYPKFNLWFLAFIAFIPLFFMSVARRPAGVFLYSFLSGTLFYIFTLSWLIPVTRTGTAVLSACMGLYTALFMSGFAVARQRFPFGQRLVFVSGWWVVLEYARAHFLTGFPWGLLAYTQTFNLVVLQAADLGGAYLVSFLVMFVNVFVFEAGRSLQEKKRRTRAEVLIPLLIIFLWVGYGLMRLKEAPGRSCPLKVSLCQGNIPQEIKWLSSSGENIFNKYKLLTEIAVLRDAPDLVIWPETAYPEYLEIGGNDTSLRDLSRSIATPLLAGSIRLSAQLRYFNSAILFSGKGDVLAVYDKIHLVPFGEYIPGRKLFPKLGRLLPIEDFTPGRRHSIFSRSCRDAGKETRWGVLICFEDIFPELSRAFVLAGADFLVNMTNDAWFGDTACPYQHMQASVFRAVENRVFVVRVANTGFSCIIDDKGRVTERVRNLQGKETFITGTRTGVVYKTASGSLYTKTGDIFVALCGLCLIVLMGMRARKV